MKQIKGKISAGGVILNDYVIATEEHEEGYRLIITRGSERQVLELQGGGINLHGAEGQVIGFDAAGEAQAVNLLQHGYVERVRMTDLSEALDVIDISDEGMEAYLCRMSDLVPEIGELSGASGSILINLSDGEEAAMESIPFVIAPDEVFTEAAGFYMLSPIAKEMGFDDFPMLIVVREDNFDLDGIRFEKKGLYFMHYPGFLQIDWLHTPAPLFPGRTVREELLPDQSVFVVHLTPSASGDKYTADRDRNQIAVAHDAGRWVVCEADGILMPLLEIGRIPHESGITLISHVRFAAYTGGSLKSVYFSNEQNVSVYEYGIVATLDGQPAPLPGLSEHEGKLFCVGKDGTIEPVALGAGLSITNGVLTLTNA